MSRKDNSRRRCFHLKKPLVLIQSIGVPQEKGLSTVGPLSYPRGRSGINVQELIEVAGPVVGVKGEGRETINRTSQLAESTWAGEWSVMKCPAAYLTCYIVDIMFVRNGLGAKHACHS